MISMNIVNVKEIDAFKNPHGVDARKLFNGEHAQVICINLKPGENLVKHTTPVDVFFYVLRGEGTVFIGDEKEVVVKDTFIESPANIPHYWENNGNEELSFLVVKTPNPTI